MESRKWHFVASLGQKEKHCLWGLAADAVVHVLLIERYCLITAWRAPWHMKVGTNIRKLYLRRWMFYWVQVPNGNSYIITSGSMQKLQFGTEKSVTKMQKIHLNNSLGRKLWRKKVRFKIPQVAKKLGRKKIPLQIWDEIFHLKWKKSISKVSGVWIFFIIETEISVPKK